MMHFQLFHVCAVLLLVSFPCCCTTQESIRNSIIGEFPDFTYPYEKLHIYLLFSAFPSDTTSDYVKQVAGDIFNQYVGTHCGIGFWNVDTNEQWSVELEPVNFIGQFIPNILKGNLVWSNDANIRIRRHAPVPAVPSENNSTFLYSASPDGSLEAGGTMGDGYWKSSKFISSSAVAAFTALQRYLTANIASLTSDLQPFTVIGPTNSHSSYSTLIHSKSSFTFCQAVLHQMALSGVQYDIFTMPVQPSLQIVSDPISCYLPSKPINGNPLSTLSIPRVPVNSAVVAWYASVALCLQDISELVVKGGLGGMGYISMAQKCMGGYVYVYGGTGRVYNVTVRGHSGGACRETSSPTAPNTTTIPPLSLRSLPLPLFAYIPPSALPHWALQDLAILALIVLISGSGTLMAARVYCRQSRRRTVSLSGERLAKGVFEEVARGRGFGGIKGSSLVQYFTRPRGKGGTGNGSEDTRAAEDSSQKNTLRSPNTLQEMASRRSLRLSVLQASSNDGTDTHHLHHDATPMKPKFPLSATPGTASHAAHYGTPYVQAHHGAIPPTPASNARRLSSPLSPLSPLPVPLMVPPSTPVPSRIPLAAIPNHTPFSSLGERRNL